MFTVIVYLGSDYGLGWKAGDDKNGSKVPKRRAWRRFGPRLGASFSSFVFTNDFYFIGSIYLEGTRLRRAATTEMSPNDARRVDWA